MYIDVQYIKRYFRYDDEYYDKMPSKRSPSPIGWQRGQYENFEVRWTREPEWIPPPVHHYHRVKLLVDSYEITGLFMYRMQGYLYNAGTLSAISQQGSYLYQCFLTSG